MVKYKWLFDKLEKNPLLKNKKQQLMKIVIYLLAAGSGKSSTIIAKVVTFLKRSLLTSEILVLAYNKDAQLNRTKTFKANFKKN